ncbi:HEPN domain-containing protein [Candidatus Parcubacteria bacterium]|nr:HEPN domain-containing protein [Candidatus Parcubacteria bacterium]
MKEENSKEKLVKEWLSRATDDELSIEAILKEEGAPSTACFLSQQLAEKYFKAFLVFHNKPFPKIHHLDVLLELCIDIDKNFKELKEETILLSDYYIETRYPGGFTEEWSWQEAKTAFSTAIDIKEFVSNKISTLGSES